MGRLVNFGSQATGLESSLGRGVGCRDGGGDGLGRREKLELGSQRFDSLIEYGAQ